MGSILDVNLPLLETDYHGELTGVTNTYSSGTCQLILSSACRYFSIIAVGTDDIVYAVFDSSSPATDLADSTKRYKFIGTSGGTQTFYGFNTAKTIINFLKRNAGSIAIYVDAFR